MACQVDARGKLVDLGLGDQGHAQLGIGRPGSFILAVSGGQQLRFDGFKRHREHGHIARSKEGCLAVLILELEPSYRPVPSIREQILELDALGWLIRACAMNS